ncbi:DNA polymerase, partial [Candidatus Aerophobetes bacterium]|nr:DNA polymerase [Candidatus Aerophobetes bacterium]
MKTEFFLLDADYIREKDKTLVRVFGKTERGEKVIALFDCEPYFYVLPDNDIGEAEKDINALLKKEEKVKIKRIERVIKEFDGEKKEFLKII